MKPPSQEDVEAGIAKIRTIRKLRGVVFLSIVPVMLATIFLFQSEAVAGVVFVVYAIVLLGITVKLMLVPCPRCRCEFHLTTAVHGWARKCGNCGLSIDAERAFFW